MPIEPFLGATDAVNEIGCIQCHFSLDHAINRHRPRIGFHPAGFFPDILGRAEFIEIGVGRGLILVGDGAVKRVGPVAGKGIAANGGKRTAGKQPLSGQHRAKAKAGKAGGLQPLPAVHIDVLRCGGGLGQFPAAP